MTEYKLQELELMTSKLGNAVSELQKIEQYTIFGVAVFYGWLLSGEWNGGLAQSSQDLGLWLPPILVLLGAIRAKMQRQFIADLARYIQTLERDLADQGEAQGWETYYDQLPHKYTSRIFRLLLWWGGTISTTFLALYHWIWS